MVIFHMVFTLSAHGRLDAARMNYTRRAISDKTSALRATRSLLRLMMMLPLVYMFTSCMNAQL